MATSQIASMLDELMGRNRNFAPDDAKARELKWTDPDICKYYIVQFCPHDLFTNTKADLGTCGKIHDDALKVCKFGKSIQSDLWTPPPLKMEHSKFIFLGYPGQPKKNLTLRS